MKMRRLLTWLLAPFMGCFASVLILPIFVLLLLLSIVSSLKGSSVTFSAQHAETLSTVSWTGKKNQSVVEAAFSMTPYLHSSPDTVYAAGFPQAALNYWGTVCPASTGCFEDWQSGSLQCVLFVAAAYHLAGQDLPYAPDAVVFWNDYQNLQGWQEIAGGTSEPLPGDLIVWSGGSAGHVAIIVNVKLPTTADISNGTIEIAQANGPKPVETLTLAGTMSNLTVQTPWSGYVVLGYIRHTTFVQ